MTKRRSSLNIADLFSIYRIVAAPVLGVLIFSDKREIFTWLLLFSYLTDMIDGFLARNLKITSKHGSILDSIGDQLTFVVALVGVCYFETDFVLAQIYWIGTVVVLYFSQMIIALFKYGKVTSFHTYLAKLSAILQGVFIIGLLFFGPFYPLFYAVIILGIIETVEEIILIFLFKYWVNDVKGLYWAMNDQRRTSQRAE